MTSDTPAPAQETQDDEQALANDLCTSAHDRPADGSEGPACQECYDLACSVIDTPWLAGYVADRQAEALREAADEIETRLMNGPNAVRLLRERADRIGRGAL